jgi:magnesium chelatase family protein
LDRIDLHIEVPAVPFSELSSRSDGTNSASMRELVYQARAVQAERFGPGPGAVNSRMSTRQLRRSCPLDEECQSLLRTAMEDLGLSARAHDRILRMSRTIADLDGSPEIGAGHLSEAIQYRSLDRRLWAR